MMTTLTVEPLGDNWHVAGGASWIGPFPSKEAAQRYVQRDKLLEALEKLLAASGKLKIHLETMQGDVDAFFAASNEAEAAIAAARAVD